MTARLEWMAPLITLDLEEPSDFQPRSGVNRSVTRSDAGTTAAIVLETYDEVEVAFEAFSDATWRNALWAWWSWARQGKVFGFALDNTKTSDTLVSSNAYSGDLTIAVADTFGFVAGDTIRLRSADRVDDELVTVTSVGSGSLTVSEFRNDYPAGSSVRHFGYYPSLYLPDDTYPFHDNPFLTWNLRFVAREYVSP